MHIDFAPLESMTDDIYRRIHRAHFPGADRYFIPFVTPTQHLSFTPKEKKALSPHVLFCQGCFTHSIKFSLV